MLSYHTSAPLHSYRTRVLLRCQQSSLSTHGLQRGDAVVPYVHVHPDGVKQHKAAQAPGLLPLRRARPSCLKTAPRLSHGERGQREVRCWRVGRGRAHAHFHTVLFWRLVSGNNRWRSLNATNPSLSHTLRSDLLKSLRRHVPQK